MSGPAANVVFIPWVRQGAAAAISTVDKRNAQPGSAVITAAVAVNSADSVPMAVRLYGPADVVGINPRAIVRREPRPDTMAFEDNHFAAIEFDRADFPWLLTPLRADEAGTLRPWLCLVVVRKQKGVTLEPAYGASLARLEIVTPALASEELPDLNDSWLWAHGQVTGGEHAAASELSSTLAGDPDLSSSRLLCPRVLQPDTEYFACLVPTFEAGRCVGLGLPVENNAPLAPAWSATASSATLPVYDYWSFRTGAGGDFKTLVQKLTAQPPPVGLGKRPIDISQPGFELGAEFPPDTHLDLEGALQPMRAPPPEWPPHTAEPFQTALADIVNTTDPEPGADPLLTPPLYGHWHAGRETATLSATSWFDELNLDPRHRVVAAFGTRVVQEHQEALMASAWEQAGDLKTANQRMRQLQLGLFASTSLHQRYFDRMEADALLRVAAPAFSRIRAIAAPGETQAKTMLSAFEGVRLPVKAVMPAMRKLSRSRGPLSRRVTRAVAGSIGMNAFVARLNAVAVTFTTGPAPGMCTFNRMREAPGLASMKGYPDVTQEAVAAVPGAPQFQLMPEGVRIRMPIVGAVVEEVDNPVATAFRAAALAHLGKLNPARPWLSIFAPKQALSLEDTRAQLRERLQPRNVFVALAKAVVSRAEPAAPSEPTDPVPVRPMTHEPRFPQPMYEALRDLSQELLLPGLDKVLANSVIGLRTNERFVNAYMVGLNVEMGRELLWRGYPTDQRGTYFDRFWDAAGAATEPDIPPVDEWGSRPLQSAAGTAGGNFVMLLRSELLQRYPTASIYAVPGQRAANGQRVPSEDHDAEVHPIFRGSLPPDVTFIGFKLTEQQITAGEGYFIVIQEQPTEPRFGLDGGLAPAGEYLATASGAPAGLALRNLTWRQNAAHMAGILRRRPVRIAIHASRLIAAEPS